MTSHFTHAIFFPYDPNHNNYLSIFLISFNNRFGDLKKDKEKN